MAEPLKGFDGYYLKARILPALLAVVPVIATLLAWFPDLLLTNVGGLLGSLAGSCGLVVLMGEVSRSRGKRLETKLLQDWGGWPSTQALRHRDTRIPAVAKAKYHRFLTAQAGLGALPTPAEELADPAAADQAYEACVLWLKSKTRGSGMLLSENIAYGFRRNLLGLKPIALWASGLALVVPLIALFVFRYSFDAALTAAAIVEVLRYLTAAQVGAIVFDLVMMGIFLGVVKPCWVRQAGDQYADRLFECCEGPAH